jgi:dienelactone hydrolase
MPRDDDEMLPGIPREFGSGIIGTCDVCGKRQAVIVLSKERFKLCVLDFLNKTWTAPGLAPGAPLPPYRSERLWYPTERVATGKAPAILLTPTRQVRHPQVLVTPDIFGLTTSVLDAGIRMAREGFEVLLPDVGKTTGIGPSDHLAMRVGARFRAGVPLASKRVTHLRGLYADALRFLRGREMADADHTAVLGISYGGSLAIALAGEDARLAAILLAYPVPVRPPEYLKLLSAPVFFVHAGRDAMSRRSRAQFEEAQVRREVDVRFSEFPTMRHHFLARDLGGYDLAAAEAAWGQMAAFARDRLLPPPPKPPAPPARAAGTPPPPIPPPVRPATAPAPATPKPA